MKLYKSWLLPATCTIIIVVTTYATTTQAAKQRQAEVNLQQVAAASPSRPLKYGDKTTKKLPNQEVVFPSTAPTAHRNNSNTNKSWTVEGQQVSRNRSRSRTTPIEVAANKENVPIARRRHKTASRQNELYGPEEIPLIQKHNEFDKKVTSPENVRHEQTLYETRPRSKKIITQSKQHQQLQGELPPHSTNQHMETERNIARIQTTTMPTSRQTKSPPRKPTITSRATPVVNVNSTPSTQHNLNARTQHPSNSNPTTVRYYHGSERHRMAINNANNTKPLLVSPKAVATSGPKSKGDSCGMNRQTGNLSDNQSLCENGVKGNRSFVRKFKSNASPGISTISPASLSTPTTTFLPQFQFPNSFNIFAPEFWQFLSPTSSPISRIQATTETAIVTTTRTTTSRKPPKKYKPPSHLTAAKEEKLSLVKPKPTIQSRTTTQKPEFGYNHHNNDYSSTNPKKKDEGPFRIALPTFNILNSKRETHEEVEKGKRNVDKESNLRERFECPRESEVRFQLFPKICKIDEDCKVWNREQICCDIFGAKSCVAGLPKPLEETSHSRVIPRKCPSRPLAELWWEVKECDSDMDCWPRVCCPDGRKRYCRTSQPELNTVPVPVQRSFNYLSEYLECTAPPPPVFDLHPKPCTSTLDCFPNVCCQEAGLRHCRPPKKSVLTMLANIFNVDFVKRLTQNIVIK